MIFLQIYGMTFCRLSYFLLQVVYGFQIQAGSEYLRQAGDPGSSPCLYFYSMYLYRPDAATAILLPAGIALLLTDSAAAYLIAKALGFTGDEKNTFRALSTLSNAGQIGIALILMIFSHPPYASDGAAPCLDEARGAIVLLLILMNIAINTVGASLLGAKGNSLSSTVNLLFPCPLFTRFSQQQPSAWAGSLWNKPFCGLCFPISQALSSFSRRLPPARSFTVRLSANRIYSPSAHR